MDGKTRCGSPIAFIFSEHTKIPNLADLKHDFTYHCSTSSMEANAIDLNSEFSKDPVGTIDKILRVSSKDKGCCHPYTKFTKLFLDNLNPYHALKTIKKPPVFEHVQRLYESKSKSTSSSWKMHMAYAMAYMHYENASLPEAFQMLRSFIHKDSRFSSKAAKAARSDGPTRDRKLVMVTVASDPRPELEYLIHTCAVAGVELYLLGFGVP
jgi:hypothetical protein